MFLHYPTVYCHILSNSIYSKIRCLIYCLICVAYVNISISVEVRIAIAALFWYCPHRICNGTVSIRLSVCLSHLSTAAAECSGFAAVGPAGRRYRSIAARPAPQQHGAQQRSAQQQMRAVPRLQLTYEARRKLSRELLMASLSTAVHADRCT